MGFGIKRRRPSEDRDKKDWSDAVTTQGMLTPPEAGGDKETPSPRAFRGSSIVLTRNNSQ